MAVRSFGGGAIGGESVLPDFGADKLTDLLAPLEADQTILLQVIAEPYIKHERWPTFAYVSGELRRRGLNARDLLRSMPRTQAVYGAMGGGYGLVKAEQFFQADSDVWLTVAGQFHVPALTSRCRSFVLAVQDLRRFLTAQPSSPFESRPVYVRGVNMSDGSVGRFSPPFARVLLGMLIHEPVTFHNGFEVPRDGSDWKLSLSQTLLEFDNVRTIEDYVGRVVELTGGNAARQDVGTAEIPPVVAQKSESYAAAQLLNALREMQSAGPRLNLSKLMQLLEELDGCFEARYAFASHALLRAVLDHLPPLFGYDRFSQVASNVSCSATDRKYLKRLGDFRNQADDVLHRQISARPSVLTMDDMPPRAALNALLNLAILQL